MVATETRLVRQAWDIGDRRLSRQRYGRRHTSRVAPRRASKISALARLFAPLTVPLRNQNRRGLGWERILVDCPSSQFAFDLKQTVVLRHALASTQRASLDLPSAHGDSEIGNEGVFRLT